MLLKFTAQQKQYNLMIKEHAKGNLLHTISTNESQFFIIKLMVDIDKGGGACNC